jgi:iron complex outermembrane receptor protein
LNVIVLNNAGDAEVYGLEVDLTARPTDRLLFRLSANAMDTEITKINPDVRADYQGNRLANAPEVSASAILRYDLPTENAGFGSYLMLDGSYRGKTYYSLNNRGQSSQDAFGLINARIGFTSLDERWELALWGRNLADKLYVSSAYDNFGGIFPSQNFLGEPRSYGVSATFRY